MLGRVYGGRSAEERVCDRRERLIQTGIEVFGTVGYHGASVRAVCRECGLSERYFHESFPGLEDLFIAVHGLLAGRVRDELVEALADAAFGEDHIAIALSAMAEALTRDPRVMRIETMEIYRVSERVDAFHQTVLDDFAAVAVAGAGDILGIDASSLRILALGLAGAINRTLAQWGSGALAVDLAVVVDAWVALYRGTLEAWILRLGEQGVPD